MKTNEHSISQDWLKHIAHLYILAKVSLIKLVTITFLPYDLKEHHP